MSVFSQSGCEIALKYLVNKNPTTRDLVYRLFVNNITPADTDIASTYTEASGGGYAPKTLTGANWTTTQGAPSHADYAQQIWTFTGPLTGNATIYGYYATRATDGDLVVAENMPPFLVSNN